MCLRTRRSFHGIVRREGRMLLWLLMTVLYQQSNLFNWTTQIYFIMVVREWGQLSFICTAGECVTPQSLAGMKKRKKAKTELKILLKGSKCLQSQRQLWQNSHSSASISYLFLVRETCCHSDYFFLNLFTHPVDSENCSIPHLLLLLMQTGKCFMLNTQTHSVCVL